jgi:hypothetical protein
MFSSYHQQTSSRASLSTHQNLLLLLRQLLVLGGVEGNRVVLLEIDGELLKVPVLDILHHQLAYSNASV